MMEGVVAERRIRWMVFHIQWVDQEFAWSAYETEDDAREAYEDERQAHADDLDDASTVPPDEDEQYIPWVATFLGSGGECQTILDRVAT